MTERHEHTNPWADRLQEVQLPDANDSWSAMEALLDKEMPLGRRSDQRRWLLVILLLLLLIGVCNCPRQGRWSDRGKSGSSPASDSSARSAQTHRSAGPTPGVVSRETLTATPSADSPDHLSETHISQDPTPDAAIPETRIPGERIPSAPASDGTSDSSARSARSHHSAGPASPGSSSGNLTGKTPLQGGPISGRNTSGNIRPRHKPSHVASPTDPASVNGSNGSRSVPSDTSPDNSIPSGASASVPPGNAVVRKNARGTKGKNKGTSGATGSVVKASTAGEGVAGKGAMKKSTGGKGTGGNIPDGKVDEKKEAKTGAPGTQTTPGIPGTAGIPVAAGTTPTPAGKKGKDSTVAGPAAPVGNAIVKKKPTAAPDNKQTPANKKSAEDTTVLEPDVYGLVAGIGFNQFFSVGQQQKSDYNSSGTTGGLGDYLPIPMIRYYFSRKLYVQMEAQFNAPQFTKKDLVAGQSAGVTLPSGYIQQNSVVVKKLFYFNLPLSVHYSPIKNLYLGAGLQYSRLSNGVGLYEDKVLVPGGSDTVKAAKVYSFKGDSIYQKMRTNEFRILLDLNYTYKRFIIGARYNQALSKFLNVRISDTQVTQARNSSLQLYIRYILWDGRKKKASSSK